MSSHSLSHNLCSVTQGQRANWHKFCISSQKLCNLLNWVFVATSLNTVMYYCVVGTRDYRCHKSGDLNCTHYHFDITTVNIVDIMETTSRSCLIPAPSAAPLWGNPLYLRWCLSIGDYPIQGLHQTFFFWWSHVVFLCPWQYSSSFP